LTRLLSGTSAQALLLIAPAGFGKTSLACEWLAGREDVGWYRATPASADIAAFSVGIAEVLSPIAPAAAERQRQRLRVAETPERAARPLAEMLADDLADAPAGWILVIDDYHFVTDSTPVETFVDWLLTGASRLRLLITSRSRPGWASARRVLYGEVMEIAMDQLAMTDEEARCALSHRPDRSIRTLLEQADGWPALIGLAAISESSEIPGDQVSRDLFRYFADEVLNQEPDDLRDFMLVASVPQTVDARIAREVLEVDDAEGLIEQLLGLGLVHRSDKERMSFHPLLRDFLRRRLESERPVEYERLVARLVEDARCHRQWDLAIELAAEHGLDEQVLEMTVEASEELLTSGRVETLARWLQLCGPAVMQHPGTVMALTQIAMRRGSLVEASALADIALEITPADSPLESSAYRVAGQVAHLRSRDELALQLHQRARETAKTPSDTALAMWDLFGCAVDVESDEAEAFLTNLQHAAPSDVELRLKISYGQALLARLRGSLQGSWPSLNALMPIVNHAPNPLTRSGFLGWSAFVATLGARYAEGVDLAAQAVRVCIDYRLALNEIYCRLVRTHALIGCRDLAPARRALAELELSPTFAEDAYIRGSHETLTLRMAMAEGKAESVPYPSLLRIGQLPRALRGELLALIGLSAAARGDESTARDLTARARAATQTAEVQYLTRFTTELLTVGESADQPDERFCALAVETVDAGVADAYVTAYRAAPHLLRRVEGDSDALAATRAALRASGDLELGRAVGIEPACSYLPTALRILTPREREVIALVAEGDSNREIGRKLFIAESTVKVHLHRIFEKLGVTTRLQAALLARDLLSAQETDSEIS